MINDPLSLDDALSLLNGLIDTDRDAVTKLIDARVPCNELMLEHPTVQITDYGDNPPYVGFLGVLNGLFGTIPDGPKKGWGPIAAVYEADGTLTKFARTLEVVK